MRLIWHGNLVLDSKICQEVGKYFVDEFTASVCSNLLGHIIEPSVHEGDYILDVLGGVGLSLEESHERVA